MTGPRETSADTSALPCNVIAFPNARRDRPAIAASVRPPRQGNRSVALTGAELNARLLILLGLCTTGATSLVLAVRLLHG
jgi:hypothetical protein